MNYLAHAYLSKSFDDVLIGNFIADTVKGKYNHYNDDIQKGIRLHRIIDEFTDKNSYVKHSIGLVDADYKAYAGVIVDMFYDHFLAANWSRYSDITLPRFAEKVYATLLTKYTILPPRMKRMLPHMHAANWLVYYGDINSFHRFFKGLSYRTRFAPDLAKAADQIKIHYDEMNSDFTYLMDEMITYLSTLESN